MIHLTNKRFPAIFHSRSSEHNIAGPEREVLNHEHAQSFNRCVAGSNFQSAIKRTSDLSPQSHAFIKMVDQAESSNKLWTRQSKFQRHHIERKTI